MYEKEEQDLIVLNHIEELPSKVRNGLLLPKSGSSVENKREYLIKTLSSGVYNTVKDKFYSATFREKVFEVLRQKELHCVTYISPLYPERLKNIPEPPAVLFCKGNMQLLNTNCFSIVGSRRATAPSIELCKRISGELTAAFTVVTGTAEGADSAAIEGALPSGKIVCALASGCDYYYPAVNRNLIEKVAQRGLLITEYLPHIQALRYNFPQRNRIIAGLSRGTLVVAAGEKSGALITADYAIEYGRDVFAVPYGVGAATGAGCNALIKNGAYLTESAMDIFAAFGLDLSATADKVELTQDERTVLTLIKETGEGFLPNIAQQMNTLVYKLIPVIASLEIKGLIMRLGGNRYGAI